ncbi:MAG: hypothetical protein QM661_01110, partial [Solimonas sp.]
MPKAPLPKALVALLPVLLFACSEIPSAPPPGTVSRVPSAPPPVPPATAVPALSPAPVRGGG